MAILLTGGAGFIGSCLLKKLNELGIVDVYIVDNIGKTEKWKNLVGKRYREYINKAELFSRLDELKGISHIIHLGACSSTTEDDFDYLWNNNVEFSKKLFQIATIKKLSFIYASSAATYGDGSLGFYDKCDINELKPMNRYGYSKQLFDSWQISQVDRPPQVVGLKFFNVYGPNEYHKDKMASMIYRGFNQISQCGGIKLFKSNNEMIKDGDQCRDFVYVKDVCDTILWFLNRPKVEGIYNVGCGKAFSFNDLAHELFSAMDIKTNIEYIDMPKELEKQYQNFTIADIHSLRSVGCDVVFRDLKAGVSEYVKEYLSTPNYY